MSRILAFTGSTIGGAAGWWLGAHFGIFTAFILSVFGTAAGVYAGRRLAARLED
jgi:hypothetical protein